MKILIKITAVLIAVTAIGGLFAFRNIEKADIEKANAKLDDVWFIFNSPLNPGDAGYNAALQDPDNYSPTHSSTPPTVCEEGEDKVCAVKTTPSSGDPDQPDSDELTALLPEMTNPDPDTNIVRLKPEDDNNN